ncbi:YgaP family membrane protein [Nocardioides dilutus]
MPAMPSLNLDRAVLGFAGVMILISAILASLVSAWWLLLTAFVGLNLLQSSVTGFCPAALVFKRFGVKDGCAFS